MTTEQAITYLTEWKNAIIDRGDTLNSQAVQALIMAIKALEQEPSEDCIDRYSALAEVNPLSYDYKAIKELPSVVPSRATGKWELTINDDYKCDNCGMITSSYKANYCPNCGARMESGE